MPRRLRVVTLIDRPSTSGGGERMACMLAAGLDPQRFERILCSSRPGDGDTFEAELEEAGVRLLVLPRRGRLDLAAWKPLYDLLRRERVDILHAHKFGSNVWGTTIARLARVPVVIAHEHTWSYEGQPLRRLLDRELVARGADAFVAVSREDERRMIAIERIPPEVIRFVPNGIPPLSPRGADVRAELGLPADALVVGSIGQLRRQKGFDVLIEAAALLAPAVPGLRVLIAGPGPEEGALRALVRERGLEDVVVLPGLREDVADVMAAIDVAVCSSHFEGSPLSVMEYMAAGLPVVGTRVGGVPDLVEHDVHGLLVEPGDPVALKDAIARLLADPQRRAQMGRRARDRQRAEFGADALVKRVEDLYEELFRGSTRARRENWAPPDGDASVSAVRSPPR